MAYNLSTIRAAVRNRLDDEDFEDEFLDKAINYAQWAILNNRHLTLLETSTTLSVSTNDISVPFPADFHEKLYLLITVPANARADITDRYIAYDDFVNSYISPVDNPVNMPYNWSTYGSSIMLSAPANTNYTLRLDYLRKAPKLVDDEDVPLIPEEFEELLVLGAYMRIAKREDDYDVKNQEMIDYQQYLNDLLAVFGRTKTPGGMRRMRVR